MPFGAASNVRSNLPAVQRVQGVWTGAGTSNLTLATGDYSRGIVSVTRTALGKYTINLADWGNSLVLNDIKVMHTTGGTTLMIASATKGGFNSTAGTLNFETVLVTTGALTDVVSGDKVQICLEFVRSKP